MDAFEDTAYDTQFNFAGLPQDRASRVAARRAFVEMKLLFLRATGPLEDRKGEWLRHQVRQATDPMDLWLLRGPVLRALSQDDQRHRSVRAELYRSLDSIFPEAFGFDPGATLPPTMPAPWEAMANEPRAGGYIR
ncbi:MAG TPA: hypothetical protein VFY73_12895 [Ideonella sp.]|uniref:hypothetical protein n=1 Tax=Ideonella sp. TaxID=1929293 RepID=UPI002E36DAE8|nr:hypothetical protein [Ideonella sp.]HEX5684914.1 hypothetical protein [Ideonella sp.]